jgi:hypothetical protein
MHNVVRRSHSIEYRREIDGLRAIAVLPVVFFHAGLPGWDIAKIKFLAPERNLSTSYDRYKARNKFIPKVFGEHDAPNISEVRTAEMFCNELSGRCAIAPSLCTLTTTTCRMPERSWWSRR